MSGLIEIIKRHKQGASCGVYSVCSANRLVLEAAILQAKKNDSGVLIEATSNQVNQFGGYTGMNPAAFREYVYGIADELRFPIENIWLGGDHLGPNCWQDEPVEAAMDKSRQLIKSYVAAGFNKIHLDTSMSCQGDPLVLDDERVAERAADLCQVAEATAIECFGQSRLLYVVGTEVPVPGGETEEISGIHITTPERAGYTLDYHRRVFAASNLQDAWLRVIGLVVQPGVEFDHTSVIDYQPEKAVELSRFIENVPHIVFEAHSTDYQTPDAYKALVHDHFAILKVGPQLTFAMREALYSLADMEEALVPAADRSHIREVMEKEMLASPGYWNRYYGGTDEEQCFSRTYSYSDRIRYYWNTEAADRALMILLGNFQNRLIPMPLISQYLPDQYRAIRRGSIKGDARSLIHHRIMQVMEDYAIVC
ncbi:D-tagatose-1,6-bisphosphate aldolase subunit KbaZ [invertebrate metagenome]|uniref:D-tagatose-1,6-bisphosphate aldolase subunit KbaZ n=1 Tax=invertebrate metagenome TaxID=1711999 RepID=A0A2H9T4Z9_9ZZZZ